MEDADVIKVFFEALESACEDHVCPAIPHDSRPRKILFLIDQTKFLFTLKPARTTTVGDASTKYFKSCIALDVSAETNNYMEALRADCTISTNISTMVGLCLGDIKPMPALLSGTLKLSGDRKAFASLGAALKLATESTVTRVLAAVRARSDTGTAHRQLLEVVITGAKEVEDIKSEKCFVQYILNVKNVISGESWQVRHRFSEFVDLYRSLSAKRYTVPKISNTIKATSLFKSDEKLVYDRAIELGAFLQVALLVAGDSSDLNFFLGNRSGVAVRPSSTVTAAAAAAASAFAGGLQGLRRPPTSLRKPLAPKLELLEAEKLVREHANKPIQWDDSERSISLLQELSDLRKTVQEHTTVNSVDGGLIMRIFNIMFYIGMLTINWVCMGNIAGSYSSCANLGNQSTTCPSPSSSSSAVLFSAGTMLFLLLIPSLRRTSMIMIVAWLLVNAAAQCLMDSIAHHAHSTATSVAASVSVSADNQYNPLLDPDDVISRKQVLVGATSTLELLSVHALVRASFVLLYDFAVAIFAAIRHTSAAKSVLYLLGFPLVGKVLVIYLGRAVHLYSVGIFIMAIYLSTKLILTARKVPEVQREYIYSTIDAVVAPFITYQFGQLKSIFVKFAQVLGGRSDILSAVWTSHLSKLQDACPNSPPDYVQRVLRQRFGDKLGDIFESFEMTPIASASIGQVHVAVVKGRIEYGYEPTSTSTSTSTPPPTTSTSAPISSPALDSGSLAGTSANNPASGTGSETKPKPRRIPMFIPATATAVQGVVTGSVAASPPSSSSSSSLSPTPASVTTSTENVVNATDSSPSTVPLSSTSSAASASTSSSTSSTAVSSAGATATGATASTDTSNNKGAGIGLSSPSTDDDTIPTVQVVVKIQHENIEKIMTSDIRAAINMTRVAAYFDSRWDIMLTALTTWQKTIREELDFTTEANNLLEVGEHMTSSQIQAQVPVPLLSLTSKSVLVMSRLTGHKVTDKVALSLRSVDKKALLNRIAHCCAHQLLVTGVFNADPHAGNLLFCPRNDNVAQESSIHSRNAASVPSSDSGSPLSTHENASFASTGGTLRRQDRSNGRTHDEKDVCVPECVPGLLDFGMTVRITRERREAYCKLVLGLYEGDFAQVRESLSTVGYATNQTDRAPERDAEFFEFIFRDAKPRSAAMNENKAFFASRKAQREADKSEGKAEKGGRHIRSVPDDFLFLTRVIGLLRGMTAELECSCPILHILALHGRVGLLRGAVEDEEAMLKLQQEQ